MTENELKDLIDQFGGDLSAWPEPERTRARQACESDPACSAVLQDFQALEHLLAEADSAPNGLPDDYSDLVEDIVAQACGPTAANDDQAAPSAASRSFGRGGKWAATFFAASLVLGLVLGGLAANRGPADAAGTADQEHPGVVYGNKLVYLLSF